MGRKKEPLEVVAARARGSNRTLGKRELVPANPTLVYRQTDVIPKAPRGLGPRGKKTWSEIFRSGFWLKPDQDGYWVEMIARCYDEVEEYRARIKQDGLIARGSLGQPVANPLIQEVRRCEAQIRQCLATLGFSPTDRARLGILEMKARTGLEDLQERQRARAQTSP